MCHLFHLKITGGFGDGELSPVMHMKDWIVMQKHVPGNKTSIHLSLESKRCYEKNDV